MQCMKCKEKINDHAAFCENCLAEMEKYPVKPNTAVYLPPRNTQQPVKKKSRRHWENKPEELLRRQQLIIRCLTAALAVTVAAFFLSAVLLLKLVEEREDFHNLGQNYGTVSDNRPT